MKHTVFDGSFKY